MNKLALCLGGLLLFKFLYFNLLWCLPTTFVPFSTIELYATSIIATLVLLSPYYFFKWRKIQILVMLLTDGLLIANLMYFRTYYTAIPLSSYLLGGNLADFKASVYDSLRWSDIVFPLSTLLAFCVSHQKKYRKNYRNYTTVPNTPVPRPKMRFLYPSLLIGAIILFGVTCLAKGGFQNAYNKTRQKAYLCSSNAAIYSVFGTMCYDWMDQHKDLTPQEKETIDQWLANRPPFYQVEESLDERQNLLIVFAESFESWVLEKTVEGQELTPYLNKLIQEPTTLYAPHVLTQVNGGRSIDAQLMILAGLLPIKSGPYSSQYADNTFFTLPKALKAKNQARSYLLTIDKLSTWNQGPVSQSFGTDTLISYNDFELTEAFGTHKRTGDGSFFRQCQEKIENKEIWSEGENVYMQFVTYSGHAPFKLPEELKEVSFSDTIPEKAADYMTTARYTDKAIGKFVEYLQTLPDYKNTLVVITGDHEGLATYRKGLCQSPGSRYIVSDKLYTPLIILNSPKGMRYEKVMGQIDIYPTLLQLMGLNDYPWKGLGQSILDPNKKEVSVSPQMDVEGAEATPELIERAKQAYDVSDLMIRFNYLKDF